MKKVLLLLLLISAAVQAQIVNIPNYNFKAKLLAAGPSNQIACKNGVYVKIDTNNDNNIQLSEAMAIDSLNIGAAQISDITGLSSFSNLKKLVCSGNPIGTLDVSGMTGLKRLHCEMNQLAVLNVAPLVNLIELRCYGNQLTTLDVSALSALRHLSCGVNLFTAIDVSALQELKYLDVSNGNLTALDVSALTNLRYLRCENNALTSLQLAGATSLFELNCDGNDLTTLDLGGLPSLVLLYCSDNQFTNLDFTNCPSLGGIEIGGNNLQLLNVSGLPHLAAIQNNMASGPGSIHTINASGCTGLDMIWLHDCQLTELDLTGCSNLKNLRIWNNSLTHLDVSDAPGLLNLDVSTNQLASLNVSNCSALETLSASHNQLTAIDLFDCTALQYIDLWDNQLTSLDASNCTSLNQINFVGNPLVSLFLKNGRNENLGFSLGPNPGLQYVCVDESQLAQVQNDLSSYPNIVVNSYCSFTPGGLFNTIAGTVRFDANGDGCGAGDVLIENLRINIATASDSGAVFSNHNGSYTFYTGIANTTLTPSVENSSYFNITPVDSVVNFPAIDGSTQTADFCLSANGVHPDVEIVIVPIGGARPGFDATYQIIYRNKGNQVVSGPIGFQYEDSVLDFVQSSLAPDAQSAGNLDYSYSNLFPFETRSIFITFNVNSPMETPAVNIGDVLHYNATISAHVNDGPSVSNEARLNQVVIGSYDPNDKQCLDGTTVNPNQIGDYLHYVIHFENTGTAAAENVVVRDAIDETQFEVGSLQMLSASHALDIRMMGNKVEFIFNGIQLGAGEHGHVVFKIKTKSNLAVNSSVSNKADIFFDYNFPVITEPAVTTFTLLGTEKFTADASIRIFPNPTKDVVKVEADGRIQSVTVYDAQGRLLQTQVSDAAATAISLQGYAAGIYYLKVGTASGYATQSIVKK
ncbi:leucine-rich repeat domain-containing protein [Flavobacterium sp.]|uniref:DUF7619 domain-containing protein n=1 Tax=Flavobacterium sp. TaxID=239 RepID=UPI0039E3868E